MVTPRIGTVGTTGTIGTICFEVDLEPCFVGISQSEERVKARDSQASVKNRYTVPMSRSY
jgi:hypothetical protein